jgi:hypothetical protein
MNLNHGIMGFPGETRDEHHDTEVNPAIMEDKGDVRNGDKYKAFLRESHYIYPRKRTSGKQ